MALAKGVKIDCFYALSYLLHWLALAMATHLFQHVPLTSQFCMLNNFSVQELMHAEVIVCNIIIHKKKRKDIGF